MSFLSTGTVGELQRCGPCGGGTATVNSSGERANIQGDTVASAAREDADRGALLCYVAVVRRHRGSKAAFNQTACTVAPAGFAE